MESSNRALSTAILGGSFDPVHRGHLAMAEAVIDAGVVDRILFLPCHVSPHKTGTIATSEQRLEMLRIALEDGAWSRASISRYEIEREKPSYSWQTITAFSESDPEVSWYWIVGTDQWNSLDRWARPDILREKLHFIVCPRGEDELVERADWHCTVIPFEHPASSTAIREDFEGHLDWLTPGVIDFCRKEGLYG